MVKSEGSMDDRWHSQWIDEHHLVIMQQHAPPPPVASRYSALSAAFALPHEYGDVYTAEFHVGVFGGGAILLRDSLVVPVKTWHLGHKTPNSFGQTDRDIRMPGIPSHCTSHFLLCDTPRCAVQLLHKLTKDLPPGEHVCLDKDTEVDVGRGRKHLVKHQFIARPTRLHFTPVAAFRWKDELEALREEMPLHGLRVPNFTMDEKDWHRLWFADLARQVDKMIAADDDYRRAEWRLHLRAMIDCELSHTW
jgi:hypothetical protein